MDKRERLHSKSVSANVDGINVTYFKTWNLPWWPGTFGPTWLPELGGFLRKNISQYDVVHLHGYRNFIGLQVIREAQKAGIPYILQPHGELPVIVNTFLLKRLYDRWLGKGELEGMSACIALQSSEYEQAIERGVPPEKIEIIPNGIGYEQTRAGDERGKFRRQYGLAKDRPLILFLGRINHKKGTDMLVEAFARMQHREAQLAIVGPDDGQLSDVKELIRRYRVSDRVILTGLLAGDEVFAAYRDADLFVLPARTDTFPSVLMEACQAGTPMVVTEGCEIAGLLRDRVAEVTPFDPDCFAEAMDRLLDDRSLYLRYQTNCPLLVEEEFSLSRSIDKLESLYRRVIREA
jgi:glycosyltransferase involved in cell wall biosynthesis